MIQICKINVIKYLKILILINKYESEYQLLGLLNLLIVKPIF